MTIGDRIKSRRKSLDMSVDEVAQKLKKNRATVYRYESNDIENLPLNILTPLAEVLETTPEYLMGWTDDPYDYDKDRNSIFDTIPTAIMEQLNRQFKDDNAAKWNAYQAMNKDAARQVALDQRAINPDTTEHLDSVYFSLAKDLQNQGIDPEDIRRMVDIINSIKNKDE